MRNENAIEKLLDFSAFLGHSRGPSTKAEEDSTGLITQYIRVVGKLSHLEDYLLFFPSTPHLGSAQVLYLSLDAQKRGLLQQMANRFAGGLEK